jgi:hypothetical protein
MRLPERIRAKLGPAALEVAEEDDGGAADPALGS